MKTNTFIFIFFILLFSCDKEDSIQEIDKMTEIDLSKQIYLVGEKHDYGVNYHVQEQLLKKLNIDTEVDTMIVERSFIFSILVNYYLETGDKLVFEILCNDNEIGFRDKNEMAMYQNLREYCQENCKNIKIKSIESISYYSGFKILELLLDQNNHYSSQVVHDIKKEFKQVLCGKNDNKYLSYKKYMLIKQLYERYIFQFKEVLGIYHIIFYNIINQAVMIYENEQKWEGIIRYQKDKELDIFDIYSIRDYMLHELIEKEYVKTKILVWYGSSHISRNIGTVKYEHYKICLYDLISNNCDLLNKYFSITMVYSDLICYSKMINIVPIIKSSSFVGEEYLYKKLKNNNDIIYFNLKSITTKKKYKKYIEVWDKYADLLIITNKEIEILK